MKQDSNDCTINFSFKNLQFDAVETELFVFYFIQLMKVTITVTTFVLHKVCVFLKKMLKFRFRKLEKRHECLYTV